MYFSYSDINLVLCFLTHHTLVPTYSLYFDCEIVLTSLWTQTGLQKTKNCSVDSFHFIYTCIEMVSFIIFFYYKGKPRQLRLTRRPTSTVWMPGSHCIQTSGYPAENIVTSSNRHSKSQSLKCLKKKTIKNLFTHISWFVTLKKRKLHAHVVTLCTR